MSLYNHAGVWDDPKMMPRSMFCNGYVLMNKKKMSKSLGNFLTINDAIEKFGVDATRITLADAGDSLDDANFESEMANGAILKLFTLEKWINDNITKSCPTGVNLTDAKANMDLWDIIFENSIN